MGGLFSKNLITLYSLRPLKLLTKNKALSESMCRVRVSLDSVQRRARVYSRSKMT
jgi:hypothetical protein